MNYLIDTHILIWSLDKPDKIPNKISEIIAKFENKIYVSTVSLWEISLKYEQTKIFVSNVNIDKIPVYLKKLEFELLDLSVNDAVSYHNLPHFENHKDPFDKMIINQAVNRQLPLISMDRNFEQYRGHGLILV